MELQLPDNATTCVYAGAKRLEAALAACWNPRWSQVAVIGDENVLRLHGAALNEALAAHTDEVAILGFPPGEEHKTRATKEMLESALLDRGFDRHACIIAFGGGISLDVAGFVASTYLRGISYISIPTSLLAQVDASVGGKTGVNAPQGKNLIGAIYQPKAVIADTRWLLSLPLREWRCGLSEAIKLGVIADAKLFSWLRQLAGDLRSPEASKLVAEHLVRRCLTIKGDIVQRDPRELGERVVLNFGHTFGHAIEKASHHKVCHGLAVAKGMLAEAELARRQVGFPETDIAHLRQLCTELSLGIDQIDLPFSELLPFIVHDKKRSQEQIHVVLPQQCGSVALGPNRSYSWPIPLEALEAAWEATR
ncbi:MAG: 3-dehydroquinate synthase [Deltaproteobacteria bacterium]|nr:3-dehydroquinate synthase [Deltaproteobacteria bacterium]